MVSKESPIICWFSGGVTSAVACKIAIDIYGKDNCLFVFIDTRNEDEDTYRFLHDYEKWLGINIESITNEKYNDISDVWRKYKGLNFAHGAICSSELKREVRISWQRGRNFAHQVFGFDTGEVKRAIAMKTNYPETKPIFPLLLYAYSKKDCIRLLQDGDIEIPVTYKYGFHNNNCFKTGCVQGGYRILAKDAARISKPI